MSQLNTGPSKGLVALTALAEGTIVKINASKQAVKGAAATDVLVGVVENDVAAGEVASVRLRSAQGTTKVKLGGTVAINAAVTSDANGLGVATTTAGNQIVGYAFEAGVAGDLIEVLNSTAKV